MKRGRPNPCPRSTALGARQIVLTEDGRPVQYLIDGIVAQTPAAIAVVRAKLLGTFRQRLPTAFLMACKTLQIA